MRSLSPAERELYREAAGREAPPCRVLRWPWWWRGFRGLALGPLILVKDEDPVLICHELAHVAQFRADPFRFWFRYAAGLLRFGYGRHPCEIEARRVEAAAQLALATATARGEGRTKRAS